MKKINTRLFSLTTLATAASVLTGCAASVKTDKELAENTKNVLDEMGGSYIKSSAAAVANGETNRTTNFGKAKKNWVDPIPLTRGDAQVKLPEFFQKKVSMTMPGTIMVSEVLSEMQRSVGIKFNLSPDVYDSSGATGSLLTIGGAAKTQQKASPLTVFDFVYTGTLEQGLNLLCAKINLSWKWNGNAIEIYRYETKTYNISALAGNTTTAASVDLKGDTAASVTGSGSSSNAGQSSSKVSRNANLTTWDEIKTYVLAQLSPGGSMAALESAGVITIKDIPQVHKKVEKAITELNNKISKQIYLNIDIYAINKSEQDDMGLDLSSVNWTNSSKMSLKYNKVGLGPSTETAGNFTVGIVKNIWGNPQIVARALSSLGETSIVNQFSVTTLNGQPTPIAANRNIGYLKKVTSTPDPNGGAPVKSMDPGEISEGVNINIIPKVEPSGDILLEYAMNLSQLEGIKVFPEVATATSDQIQLPTSTLKSVLQRAVLRSGETLVLSGFKQKTASLDKTGVGSPSNILLGGGHLAKTGYQYLVITVTPFIANSNAMHRE